MIPELHSAARLLLPSLACLAAGPLSAQTFDWTNVSGGVYSTGANWTPAGPPGTGATASFALPHSYSLTFSAPATLSNLTQSNGNVSFFLNGWTLQATSTFGNGMGSGGLVSSLRISNGTFLPGNFSIGTNPGSTSTLLLDAGTVTTVGSGAFYVGTSGSGTLIVQIGADLTTSGVTAIGVNASASGTATVTGSGSTWTVNNTLRVGSHGQGVLHVLNGGTVTVNALEAGENPGSTGAVTVAGANSLLTSTGTANIGGQSDLFPADAGTLSIGAGATVNFQGTTNLRTNSTLLMSGGTLNLNTLFLTTGADAAWTGGTIQFANASSLGASVLDYLLDGSHLLGSGRTLAASAGTLALGSGLQVNGRLAVPDLTIDAPLKVGSFGTVDVSTATVGPGKSLQVEDFGTFSPADYLFNNGGTIELKGPAATVTGFTANNFGTLQGTGVFAGGLNNGSGGTIRARPGDRIQIIGSGSTNPGRIELSGGTVEYTHTLSNLGNGVISGRGEFRGSTSNPDNPGLSNLGQLQFSAGYTDLHGRVNNTGTGKIIVSGGGVLTLYHGLTHNGTDLKAATGSAIVCFGPVNGSGPLSGGGTIYFENGYSPGSSPAQVAVSSQLSMGPGNTLTLEIGGTAPGSGYDQLDFGSEGELAAGGTLEVTLINGFVPQAGDQFQLLVSPKTTGSFDDILLPPLPSGLAWDDSELESTGLLVVTEDLTDTDNDGLPDFWETLHFGNLGQSSGEDSDHDGTDHLTEWLAGTDPTNPASVLRLRFVARSPSRATVAVSPYLPQRVYRLHYSDDLLTPWQIVPSAALQVMGDELWLLDPDAPDPRRFYRVSVELAP